jgi:hypothetical protein
MKNTMILGTDPFPAWINLERLKREMRGIPPLAPAKLNELPPKRQRRQQMEPREATLAAN